MKAAAPAGAAEAPTCLPHDLLNFGLGDVDGDADVLAILNYFAAMAQNPTEWRQRRLTDAQQAIVRQSMREFVLGVPLRVQARNAEGTERLVEQGSAASPIVRLLVAAIHSAGTTPPPKANERPVMMQRAAGLLAQPRSLANSEDLAYVDAQAVFDPEGDFDAAKRRAMQEIARARGISETDAEAGRSLDDKTRNMRKAAKRRT